LGKGLKTTLFTKTIVLPFLTTNKVDSTTSIKSKALICFAIKSFPTWVQLGNKKESNEVVLSHNN
jgi:hypothetical protein